jgi:hypothetical protein
VTDYVLDYATVDFKFPSKSLAGVPTAIVGGVFSVYVGNSTTQVTTGLTYTSGFDGVTGLNHIRIDLSADAAYVAGTDYQVVCTAGTVDSVSVVGEVVKEFTIQNTASFARLGAPAGASVSADILAVKTDTAAILVDTGTAGVIVATNNDKTGYSISGTKTTLDALNDIAATAVVSSGAITTSAGAVSNVTLVATTTTNTDMRGTDNAALATALTTAQNDLDIITGADGVNLLSATQASIDAIEVDTNTTLPAQITALNDISAAEVNAEVVDVLVTDTFAEVTVPAATASLKDMIHYVYSKARNKITQTSTTFTLRNDADSGNLGTATVSDDGTTTTKGTDA